MISEHRFDGGPKTRGLPMLDSLKIRIDNLERQNRSVKRLTAVLFFVITALVVAGIAVPRQVAKQIEAERFVLRDKEGRLRATLGAGEEGHMGLTLYDKSGTNRIWLGVKDKNNTVKLTLHDQEGKHRVALGATADVTLLIVYGKDGKANLVLDTMNGGAVSLARKGELWGHFGAINEDVGISFYKNDEIRARLGLDSQGAQELKFFDKDKKVIWSARQNGLPIENAKP